MKDIQKITAEFTKLGALLIALGVLVMCFVCILGGAVGGN